MSLLFFCPQAGKQGFKHVLESPPPPSPLLPPTTFWRVIVHMHVHTLPVDDCFVFVKSEYTRLVITSLRLWCYASNFYKAKAHLYQAINCFPVLIKSCCKPNWVGKLEAKHASFLYPRETHSTRLKLVCQQIVIAAHFTQKFWQASQDYQKLYSSSEWESSVVRYRSTFCVFHTYLLCATCSKLQNSRMTAAVCSSA